MIMQFLQSFKIKMDRTHSVNEHAQLFSFDTSTTSTKQI